MRFIASLLLPTTCYLLPATYYLLPTTYYLLPATCHLLPTTYYLLPTTYLTMKCRRLKTFVSEVPESKSRERIFILG